MRNVGGKRPKPKTASGPAVYHVAQYSLREFLLPKRLGCGALADLVEANAPLHGLGEFTVKNSRLKLSAAVTVGALAGAGAASAADFGAVPYAKAPAYAPVASVIGWGGFYVGANAGGVWAHSEITDVNPYAAAALPGTVTSINTSGFLAGGQAGYNWQASNYVFGLEADGGFMDLGGNKLLTGTGSGTRVGLTSGAFGDFTGRAGITFDRALFYVKGGYAIIEGASSFSTVTGSFSGIRKPSTDSGFTIGGGVEYKFAPNWSAKVEYLHYYFGNTLGYTVLAPGGSAPFNQNLRVETVKVGVNYAWGWPLMARY
jgi:outer membrane immunogenic protein